MKAVIQVLTLIALSFAFNNSANAQSAEADIKVPATRVEASAQVNALELYDGETINVVQIRRRNNSAGSILGASQIELNNGEIVYPEEVRYALVRGDSNKNPHQKNPHQQN
tara:strand:+ start:1900 stop:2232 length:333 start_codon:yes stop_codon:yes gene_type:complete